MTKGLKAIKPGGSMSSPFIGDYLYTSESVSPKVYKRIPGKIKVSSSGSATVFIPHDIGYQPANLVYINPTISVINGPTFGNFPMPASWGLIDNNFVFASSNIDNIRLDIQNATPNKEYRYVCYIFVEPAQNE